LNPTESAQYYKPRLIQENPLPLEEREIAYAKELLGLSEGDGGFIPIKLEQDVVVQRISHDLYAKPESGFRELYNNEVRACKIAKKLFSASEPKIAISLDPTTRELQIHGVDSLGISGETFKNVYTVLGRSSNFSGEEIGQFGFGRISYCRLSDIMVLETKYRTPEGKVGEFAIMGKNGVGFNLLPKPNLESFGTLVKLVLKPDVDLHRLVQYIHEACAFSGVATYLTLASDLPETSGSWRPREGTQHQRGTKYLTKTYQEKAEEAARSSYHYYYSNSSEKGGRLVKSFKLALEAAELYAEFRVEEKTGYPYRYESYPSLLRIGKDTRLLGSPVEIEVSLPFSYFILNALDEREYQPTTDRERLREDSTRTLLDRLQKKVAQEISSYLGVSSLKEFLALDEGTAAVLLSEGGTSGRVDPTSISYFLPAQTKALRSLLLREVRVYGQKESSGRYRRDARKNLAAALKGRETSEVFFTPQGTRFNRNQIEKISQEIPKASFIQLLAPSPSRDTEEDLTGQEELLRAQGILSISEFVKENREKLSRIPRRKETPTTMKVYESVVGYYSWGRFPRPRRHVETIEIKDFLPKNAIRLRGSVQKYTSLLSGLKTTYKLVQDKNQLRGGIKLEAFVSGLRKKELYTSEGRMQFQELLDKARVPGEEGKQGKKKIQLYLYSDPQLATFFRDPGEIRIFNSEDLLFEVALFLTYHSIEYSLDSEMAEVFDKEFSSMQRDHFSQSISPAEGNFTRQNFLRDPSWKKIGDSEILGSILHVFEEIQDESTRFLFARAVEGSKDASEVAFMRKFILNKWKRSQA